MDSAIIVCPLCKPHWINCHLHALPKTNGMFVRVIAKAGASPILHEVLGLAVEKTVSKRLEFFCSGIISEAVPLWTDVPYRGAVV